MSGDRVGWIGKPPHSATYGRRRVFRKPAVRFGTCPVSGLLRAHFSVRNRSCEFSPVPVYSVHVPARRPRTPLYLEHAFAKINVCRNGIAQAERSGGYRLASLQRLFLHITGSTVTTEPKSLFAGKRAAMSPFMCARVTRSNWGRLATTARKPAS